MQLSGHSNYYLLFITLHCPGTFERLCMHHQDATTHYFVASRGTQKGLPWLTGCFSPGHGQDVHEIADETPPVRAIFIHDSAKMRGVN